MMNYPIKLLTIQLEYTHTGMDEDKDTLIHFVILYEIDDWENSFDSFHTKCYQRNTKYAVSKNLCSKAHDVLVRGGEVPLLLQLN